MPSTPSETRKVPIWDWAGEASCGTPLSQSGFLPRFAGEDQDEIAPQLILTRDNGGGGPPEGWWRGRRDISVGRSDCYSFTPFNRSAFPMTLTELSAIAAAASIGDNSHPVSGNSTPAATGIPSAL